MDPALPAKPNTAAISGAATLVPPKTSQPDRPWELVESYTATPVFGSATAETSASARLLQPVPADAAPDSAALKLEQPLPAPLQTVSVQPRVPPPDTRCVPPTAVT